MLAGMFASRGAGGGGGDPYWSSVTSLLHFDGSDGSTTFTDQRGVTWTRPVGGDAELDTAQAQWGASSLLVNTGGILANTFGVFDFGTGDFTIEAWVRPAAIGSIQNIYSQREGGSGAAGLSFRIDTSGVLQCFHSAGANIFSGATPLTPASALQHVALCRAGGTWRCFVDGNLDGSASVSGDVSAGVQPAFIGAYGNFGLSTEQFVGHIDDFRATKGVARYTASFTPPIAAFPNS